MLTACIVLIEVLVSAVYTVHYIMLAKILILCCLKVN